MNASSSTRPRLSIACGAALALIGPLAGVAAGAGVGEKGTLVLSAERLFGFGASKTTYEDGPDEWSTSRTSFGVLLPTSADVFNTPRLALDVAVIDGLTLGAAFGFATSNADSSGRLGTIPFELGEEEATTLLLQPRIGYAIGFNDDLSLWLRGGLTYVNSSVETNTTEVDAWLFALNLEPTLVYVPRTRFGFTLTGLFDLPLAGAADFSTRGDVDLRGRNFGFAFGLLGLF